jgi:L-ascorbate metabolism protein UlaG (beta-lactamase superfamily)
MAVLFVRRVGLSSFCIRTPAGIRVVVDPWFDSPAADQAFASPAVHGETDLVLVSHGHDDHAGGVARICAANPKVTVGCPHELGLILRECGASDRIVTVNLGGTVSLGDVSATLVPASHSSSFGETRRFSGPACGWIIAIDGGPRLYYAGDTGLTAEMHLIRDYWHPDIAILPCGGINTMDAAQATYAAGELIRPRVAIPCHFYPGADRAQDPSAVLAALRDRPAMEVMINQGDVFKALMSQRHPAIKVVVLEPGDETEFPVPMETATSESTISRRP